MAKILVKIFQFSIIIAILTIFRAKVIPRARFKNVKCSSTYMTLNRSLMCFVKAVNRNYAKLTVDVNFDTYVHEAMVRFYFKIFEYSKFLKISQVKTQSKI